MSCLTGLVGVTESQAIPFYAELETDQKTAIAVSSSGLFVDELTGGIDLMEVDDIEYMTAALDLALKAGTVAEKTIYDELLVAIANRYHEAKPRFNGDIGRRMVSQTLSLSKEIQGHRYIMKEPIAGNIKISRISVNVNVSTTFKVYIARCNKGEDAATQIYDFAITSVAGTFTNATLPNGGVTLPMEVEGIAQEYFIYWKRTEAANGFAKNNDMKCATCSGKSTNTALMQYMTYSGASFDGIDDLNNITTDQWGHGISVSAVVQCDNTTVICREYEKKDSVRLMINKAVQYKMGELWIEYVMKSGYVNKIANQSREYMWGKRNHFASEASKRITIIADAMTLGETACYTCKQDKVIKGQIYS